VTTVLEWDWSYWYRRRLEKPRTTISTVKELADTRHCTTSVTPSWGWHQQIKEFSLLILRSKDLPGSSGNSIRMLLNSWVLHTVAKCDMMPEGLYNGISHWVGDPILGGRMNPSQRLDEYYFGGRKYSDDCTNHCAHHLANKTSELPIHSVGRETSKKKFYFLKIPDCRMENEIWGYPDRFTSHSTPSPNRTPE
jgi:hypothetical protein